MKIKKLIAKYSDISLYSLLVLLIAYWTYFRNYWYPQAMFWDEHYYIASTYKYLNHVMFMSGEPPLGKLFMALGEFLFHPNNSINMHYALSVANAVPTIPWGFSFIGIRFFPVLFGTLSAPLFFLVLYKIGREKNIALLFSSLYLFDNALILQSRGALVDSIQIFFVLCGILYFLVLLDKEKVNFGNYCFFGLLVGCIIATKLSGLLFLMFLPLLLFYEKEYSEQTISFKNTLSKSVIFLTGVLVIFFGSYYIHAKLGSHVEAQHYYQASSAYKRLLENDKSFSMPEFPLILKDHLFFLAYFTTHVRQTDANSSLPYTWPFGNKSINYRWAYDHGKTSYLYFQGNPLIWFAGLIGVILGFCFVIAAYCFKPIRTKIDKRFFFLIAVFLALYTGYMCSLLMLKRVVYLYHYLVPLVLSLFLVFTFFCYLFETNIIHHNKKLYFLTGLFVVCIILSYYFFSPLTYYQPLTKNEFLLRSWFTFWHLQPISPK